MNATLIGTVLHDLQRTKKTSAILQMKMQLFYEKNPVMSTSHLLRRFIGIFEQSKLKCKAGILKH